MRTSAVLAGLAAGANAFVLPGQYSFQIFPVEALDAGASLWPHLPYFLKHPVDPIKFQDDVQLDELNSTAWDLFDVAGTSNSSYGHPTRVIGSPGHWNTLKYIYKQFDELRDYYDVYSQTFKALSGEVLSYNLSFQNGSQVPTAEAFSLSPPVEPFTGPLVEIPNLGCSERDFEAVTVPKNAIALIERGECPFGKKSKLAGKFGFKAVVVFDNDPHSEKGVTGTLSKPTKHTVSTIGVSYTVGQRLIADILLHKLINKPFQLEFYMDSYVKEIKTQNIIADTKHGDPENIVALGAHTDSVAAGPGINDDGSGTISLLTVAKHLSKYKINNKVRFAFWSAEEEGLLGSTYYVEQLSPEENSKIRLFMDYDMMASPNYQYQVYDANNKVNPNGSEELKNLYIDYYKSHNLSYTMIPFDGRSDYVAFIENGIPGGGIATGAEGLNTDNGKVLDHCYHERCDDVSNIAWDAFLVNTKLIAYSVATFAHSLEDFPARTNSTLSMTGSTQNSNFDYRGPQLVL
ncbi:LAMI_0H14664g1_1 [Lachancea mirantina]|uniref:Peptide hydrolase n=1 Tax=Lachancea mirantina TaxID=1230905 RepID=A0A1G4KI61_9SACH|nr:LAMI_0H14664g1_1 [Lachancea mirantina]